jgi:flagellar hook assembly protein FlgD
MIAVFDMRGNRVATLVNERQDPGVRSYRWNGTNDNGHGVAAGVYIYTIQAGNFRQSKKMILLK